MKLVLMTKPTFFVEEDKIISTLFDEGLDNLHLYKPDSSPMYAERLLSLLPDSYYRKITVHDHYYLKNEYGLAGIHIESPDAPKPDGYKGRFSRTCMELDKLKAAKKKAEYVFLKYIFHSQSEKDAEATFTMEQLEQASGMGLIDKHVYALGGMNLDNVKIAKELGFGGVVICGDLWNRFDIHNQQDYKELITHFEKLRKAVG
ncbi:MAG: thiamine phosphate synthase [Prevotella sp.]|nr:thiamine phosphate synthase [Prevotella sp.]MBR1463328.1 thiamine phosphate synthase [Prevotella sp.]